MNERQHTHRFFCSFLKPEFMHRIDFSMIRNDHSCFVSLRGTDEIASRPGFVCLHFFYYYHYYYYYFLFWCAIRLEQLLLSFLFLHFDSVGPRTISRSHKTSTATRRRHRPICLFIGSRGNGIVGRFGCFFFCGVSRGAKCRTTFFFHGRRRAGTLRRARRPMFIDFPV